MSLSGRLPWAIAALLAASPMGGACRSRKALLPRGEGAAVVMVEPDAGPALDPRAVAAVDEIEPNDSPDRAQALTLSLGEPGSGAEGAWLIAGALAEPKDVDVFRFVRGPIEGTFLPPDAAAPSAHGALRLNVEVVGGSPSAVRIDVLADDGRTLARGTAAAQGWLAPNLGLTESDLVVRLTRTKDASGVTPYTLRAELRAPGAGEEQEPNDEAARATWLHAQAATAEAVGHLGWNGDVDWFAVSFPPSALETSVLEVRLDLPEATPARVVVADAAGNDWHGYARPSSGPLTLAHVRPPAGGTLWVRVQAAGAVAPMSRYRLTVSAAPARPEHETEPNDEVAQASRRASALLRGNIHPAGDRDVWKVCDATGPLTVRPPPRLALELDVLSSTGQPIATHEVNGAVTLDWPTAEGDACRFVKIREKSGKRSDSLQSYELVWLR